MSSSDKCRTIWYIVLTLMLIGTAISDISKIKNSCNWSSKNKNYGYNVTYNPAKYYSFKIDEGGRIVFSPVDLEETALSSDKSK